MTRDEFVELHGEEAWEKLVKPVQDNPRASHEQRQNANVLGHAEVMGVLKLLGLKVSGLKEARRLIGTEQPARAQSPPKDCGVSNEDLECLGCGVKIGCLKKGSCYAVEGEAALSG
jgi:hypothetical protein